MILAANMEQNKVAMYSESTGGKQAAGQWPLSKKSEVDFTKLISP